MPEAVDASTKRSWGNQDGYVHMEGSISLLLHAPLWQFLGRGKSATPVKSVPSKKLSKVVPRRPAVVRKDLRPEGSNKPCDAKQFQ